MQQNSEEKALQIYQAFSKASLLTSAQMLTPTLVKIIPSNRWKK